MRARADNGAATLAGDRALDELVSAVRSLSHAERVTDVQRIVRSAARRLVAADGATFVLRDSGQCYYADEDAISPLWKGQRFPLEACISGWTMINRRPVAIEDVYADDRISHDAYRATFVKSLVMVPIRTKDPIGAIGMYWAERHQASEREVGLACALADSAAVALDHVLTRQGLKRSVEISETDPLTGAANRRAWDAGLEEALLGGNRAAVSIAIINVDDFKSLNDRAGHQAGDELLQRLVEAWRASLRSGDLIARFGGDEFAVLMPGCPRLIGATIVERLREAVPAGTTVSIGVAQWDGAEGAESLVGRAGTALLEAKQAGGDHVAVAG